MNPIYNIRTDLALESIDEGQANQISSIHDVKTFGKVTVHQNIITKEMSESLGKKEGIYYLLEINESNINDTDDLRNIENVLTDILKNILKEEQITENQKGMIVGLGNMNITPDSLGPMVVDKIIVTRHMFVLHPEEVSPGIANICAIAPGVMGNTGIETTDIIESIIQKIDIDYLIVIDALAAREVKRVNKSIQVTNAGISPGSGVGNHRKELSKETIGCPVIAIGVPTVVDAVTITSSTFDFLLRYFQQKLEEGVSNADRLVIQEKIDLQNTPLPSEETKKHFLGEFGALTDEEKRSLLISILTPNGLNMMVTPKEVDLDIENLSDLIGGSIDKALHPLVH